MPKTKRTFSSSHKKSSASHIGLASWIGFWTLVLMTMVMIVVSFSSGIKFLLASKKSNISLAEIQLDLQVKQRN